MNWLAVNLLELNGPASHSVCCKLVSWTFADVRLCAFIHIYENECASTHMYSWISIQNSLRFCVLAEISQTIWKHFIDVIVVIVAIRSHCMSFLFASLSKQSFCWCLCVCSSFSYVSRVFIWQNIICCSIISRCNSRLHSHFLRQINGVFVAKLFS